MLGKYIKKILTSMTNKPASHSDIISICSQVVSEADELISTFEKAKVTLDINALNSANSLNYAKRLQNTVNNRGTIGELLGHNANTVKVIADGILKIFEGKKDFTVQGMTTQDALTLQLLDLCAFFNEKARMFTLLILHYENNIKRKDFGDTLGCPYTRQQIIAFDQEMMDFAKVSKYLFNNYRATADKIISSIPNENFSFDNAELMNSSRFTKLPQIKNFTGDDGLSGLIHSIISYIAIAQAAKIERAEIEVQNIEVHILELQESNVKNEKAIAYHTERLRLATDKLNKLKEKYDVN